jgi:hypothetical protein
MGVYDLAANCGWVSVGVDHDTAAFAVNSIRQWWLNVGRARYPDATRLLIKMELRTRLHDPIAKTGAWVYSVLKGHLNYFAVSGDDPSLWWFFTQVKWHWLRALRRRSQRAYINWERYIRLIDRFLPPIRILHPLPCHRFDARTRERSPVR